MYSIDARRTRDRGRGLLTVSVVIVAALLGASGCREGVLAGSVQDVFGGIAAVQPKSPTTARITWKTNYRYQSYLVYGNYSSEPLVERIKKSVRAQAFPDRCKAVKVVGTKLLDDAGVLGAALLAYERMG